MLILACYSLFCGGYIAMGTNISFVLISFRYGSDDSSFTSLVVFVFGIIGSGVG